MEAYVHGVSTCSMDDPVEALGGNSGTSWSGGSSRKPPASTQHPGQARQLIAYWLRQGLFIM
ncbi:hypothetical protein F9278_44750 [Streptomyces phaeolivaceus]|uniref:Uncharacterized protein n=1 Tax=Streptomyces phaeolivaceus TaxID=2653200 RepID=A0A5P8KH67_9ACTN|nr:hypothetical protein F9278_44750 [Streptomyces phaeolivaceus]